MTKLFKNANFNSPVLNRAWTKVCLQFLNQHKFLLSFPISLIIIWFLIVSIALQTGKIIILFITLLIGAFITLWHNAALIHCIYYRLQKIPVTILTSLRAAWDCRSALLIYMLIMLIRWLICFPLAIISDFLAALLIEYNWLTMVAINYFLLPSILLEKLSYDQAKEFLQTQINSKFSEHHCFSCSIIAMIPYGLLLWCLAFSSNQNNTIKTIVIAAAVMFYIFYITCSSIMKTMLYFYIVNLHAPATVSNQMCENVFETGNQ